MSIHLTLRALRLHTTTMCTALQQQVAKARQEHLLLWPPISRVKSFSKKNNTVVVTKLNRQNLERSCITYRVKNFYARLWPQLFWVLFFSHQIQPPPPERSASELVPCISLGVWNLVAFSSSSSNSSPSLKWWYQ